MKNMQKCGYYNNFEIKLLFAGNIKRGYRRDTNSNFSSIKHLTISQEVVFIGGSLGKFNYAYQLG